LAINGSLATMTDTGDAVTAYWAAVEVRDWDTFGALLAEDVVYEVPQTRERVRGRAAFTAFTADGFPGDWHISVQRVVGGARDAASEIEFTDAGVSQPGLTFFEFGPYGLISRITDYWPEPYEPPAGRAGLAERY
jgi:ketosteroid isomerase-like protein